MFEDGTPDELDLSSLDGGARVDALCVVARAVAHEQARLLEAMAAVAATSTGVGFDADEVAFALCLPRMAAQNQVALALDLTRRLPAVLVALRDGRICLARARVFSDVLTAVADDLLARRLADRFLPPAETWTASQLRARLTRAMLDADPGAARVRFERSIAERRVSLSHNDDTTACLSGIFLPPAKAAAAFERVDAIARGLKRDGEARTLDQLRADVFCDLLAGISPASGPILRAGAVELSVPLSTLAGLSDASGTLAGYGPVIADIARQVAAASVGTGRAAGARDVAAYGHADRPSSAADAGTDADAVGVDPAVAAASGDVVAPEPVMWWRFRVHDEDGTLLFRGSTRARPTFVPDADMSGTSCTLPEPREVADAPHNRPRTANGGPGNGGPGNGGPGAAGPSSRRQQARPPVQADDTARFPNTALRSWINARDVTCRAPGCTAPARSCDIDHTTDHADGGRTRHDNLGLLCRHHHRLKHEGGFRLSQPVPGYFRWTSANGRTYEVLPEPP